MGKARQMVSFIQGSFWGLLTAGTGLAVTVLVVGPAPAPPEGPLLASAAPKLATVDPVESPRISSSMDAAPMIAAVIPDINAAATAVQIRPLDPEVTQAAPEPQVNLQSSEPLETPRESASTAPVEQVASISQSSRPVAPLTAPQPDPEPLAVATPAPAPLVETTPPQAPVAAVQDPLEPTQTLEANAEPIETTPVEPDAVPETSGVIAAADVQTNPAPTAPEVEQEAVVVPVQSIVEQSPEPSLPPVRSLVTEQPSGQITLGGAANVQIFRPAVPDAATTPPSTSEAAPTPALTEYAAAFDNPGDLPQIAIVLLETGQSVATLAPLSDLPFAATIVIDPLAPDAADVAMQYRGAGQEVALRLPIPNGAEPADVEVAYQAAVQIVPEATLLYSTSADVVSADRRVTTQILSILGQEGRGFIALQTGFGGAVQAALDASVPAAEVQSVIDSNTANEAQVLRSLNQAALRARGAESIVLVGRMRPATVSALASWADGLDNTSFVVGPASALLALQLPDQAGD